MEVSDSVTAAIADIEDGASILVGGFGLVGIGPYPKEAELDVDLINTGKEIVTIDRVRPCLIVPSRLP